MFRKKRLFLTILSALFLLSLSSFISAATIQESIRLVEQQISIAWSDKDPDGRKPLPENYFDNLEREITFLKLVDDNTAMREKLYELVVEYLLDKRFQEAIWTLRRVGEKKLATDLQTKIEGYIKTAHIKRIGYIGKGQSGAELVDLGAGILCVLKTEYLFFDDFSPAEVWAYQLDRLWELDLVPITIIRRDSRDAKSLQLYIRDSRHETVDNTKYQMAVEGMRKLYFFDYVLGNVDRHSENWMLRPGNHLVGIDHGSIYRPGEFAKTDPYLPFVQNSDLLPSSEEVARLSKIPIESNNFQPEAPKHFVDYWNARLSTISTAKLKDVPSYEEDLRRLEELLLFTKHSEPEERRVRAAIKLAEILDRIKQNRYLLLKIITKRQFLSLMRDKSELFSNDIIAEFFRELTIMQDLPSLKYQAATNSCKAVFD